MKTQPKVRPPDTLDMADAAVTPFDPTTMSKDQAMADLAAEGVYTNALLLRRFGEQALPAPLGITESILALRDAVRSVHGGDLRAAETVLVSQALALNAMFGTLATCAEANMRHKVEATDRYMRLALKCQAQSARTLETLATIKSPPTTVVARQANISQQQIVNNAGIPARAGESEIQRTELLEPSNGHWLDTGAASTAGATHTPVAAVDSLNRAAHG